MKKDEAVNMVRYERWGDVKKNKWEKTRRERWGKYEEREEKEALLQTWEEKLRLRREKKEKDLYSKKSETITRWRGTEREDNGKWKKYVLE